MNKKSYSFDMETFRQMFQIWPKVPGQKFVDPPFEEEILVFLSDLGYPGNIKSLSEVKVEILPQPWRTFGTIINKCLSGKHEVVQKYGVILPDNLTTQAMKESKAYKTYYAFATGKAIPKPKYVRRTTKEKTEQAPKAPTEDKEEEGSDLRVQTPSHYESTNDEDSDEEIQGVNVEEEEMDEEETNKEEEVDELYRDVNVNLEGRDTK
ncbi:hypothetical protein Tco_1540050 [Tanacetum coccineum]